MKNKVKVTANEAGQVVIPSANNPQYGYIRVTQDRPVVNEDSGFLEVKTMSALIPGKVEDLKKLGWTKGQEVEGGIIFKESLSPFNKKNDEQDLKVAGETGIICRINGAAIYRKNFYSLNPNAVDEPLRDETGAILKHDNSNEIKEAYAAVRQNANLND